jgi:antitoxin component YwqK of YwqJK toxin-antitoxin module
MIRNFYIGLFITASSLSGIAYAQPVDFASQVPAIPKYTEAVVDDVYGIKIYERLNLSLKGDSMRYCGGYSCSGWIEDKYENGKLLHKGFYRDGQLQVYKNYYPDGTLEREFKGIDAYSSSMKLYHPNGKLKSEIKYQGAEVQEWIDYNKDGIMVHHEKWDKKLDYKEIDKSFFADGSVEFSLELVDKKKLIFNQKEYHKPNVLRAEGQMMFSMAKYDYQKVGKWIYYDESGKPVKEETWTNGALSKEKSL